MEHRKPTEDEIKLLDILISKSNKHINIDWKSKILIKPLKDGNMVSFEIFPEGKIIYDRAFGNQISEFIFKDLDGVDVITSLNTDKNGNLYELDIWKVDYTPLKKINV